MGKATHGHGHLKADSNTDQPAHHTPPHPTPPRPTPRPAPPHPAPPHPTTAPGQAAAKKNAARPFWRPPTRGTPRRRRRSGDRTPRQLESETPLSFRLPELGVWLSGAFFQGSCTSLVCVKKSKRKTISLGGGVKKRDTYLGWCVTNPVFSFKINPNKGCPTKHSPICLQGTSCQAPQVWRE